MTTTPPTPATYQAWEAEAIAHLNTYMQHSLQRDATTEELQKWWNRKHQFRAKMDAEQAASLAYSSLAMKLNLIQIRHVQAGVNFSVYYPSDCYKMLKDGRIESQTDLQIYTLKVTTRLTPTTPISQIWGAFQIPQAGN